MGTSLRVLILEDHPADAELVLHELRRGGFDPDWRRVDNEVDFRACLQLGPEIILADYSLPQWDAPHALRVLQETGLDIPFVMVSGAVGEDLAVECIKQGAADYLLKDRLSRLGSAVSRALADKQARIEKQQADERLRRLNELNEAIVQSAADGIALLDADGNFTFVNPAAAGILGRTPDQIVGQPWSIWVAPELHAVGHEYLERMRQGETVWYEVDVLRDDGIRRVLWASGTPRYDAGEYVGSLAIFTDITERTQAQEALSRERALLRTVIDNLPDNIFVKDTLGRIIIDNAAHRTLLGLTQLEDVLGKTEFDFFSEELAAQYTMDDQAVVQSGLPLINREEHTVDSTGATRWQLTTKVPLRNGHSEVTGLVGINRDITKRKRAEEGLVRERALLRTLIDSLPDLVYAKDTEGRFILCNQAVAYQLQVPSPEHILGRHDFDYYPAEVAGKYWADDVSVIKSGQALINQEEAIVEPDGRPGWLLTTKVPLRDGQGAVIGLVGNGRNITERKLAEVALQKSEAKFRQFVEQSTAGIAMTDGEGRIVEWNRSMEHITGLTKTQVTGQALWEIQHQVMPDVARARTTVGDIEGMIVEFIRTGRAPWALKPQETEMQRADGSRRFVQTLIFPIETAKGYIAASLVEDITERKVAQMALRESEEIMRYVVKHDPSAIAIYNTQLRYIAASDRYLHDYNVKEVDIVGKHHYEVFPEMPQRWKEIHQRCLNGAIERNDDDHFERPDGSITYNRWECRPWYRVDGQVGGIITYTEVTTERKMVELEIRKLNTELEQRIAERTTELSHIRERVEAILNSSTDIIMLCRPDAAIDQVNPALSKACLIAPDEVFRRPLTSLVVPSDESAVTDAFQTVIMAGAPERLEVTVLRSDGTTFEADMVLSPVIEHGSRLLGVVCSLRDISERKLMETQLRYMLKQAMDVSELRSRYVSMAAHDLGNPLAAIQALVSTIQMYGDRMTEAQKQAKYEEILGGVKAMSDILSDVLTIGRVEGGQLKFTPAPLDLRRFCQDMIAEVLQATDSSRHIAFSDVGICDGAFVDAKLLRHIIGNLLSNAIKYSPVESKVSFSIDCTPIQATICIQDQGIGVPEADKARLFTAFHRAGNARKIPGTGLGLAIVKQSVELHGGAISFESEQGQGTTFIVTLPTANAADQR